jgi:hypothetical protein
MEDNRSDKKELNYVTEENELNVPILVEALFVKFMGKVLDYSRMSGMSDRNMTQFCRSVKDDCYQQIKFAKTILKDYGIEEK